MKRPNVLLLYTDQQRWDTLNCAGNPHIHTPNLDRLAASGFLMENAFCNVPVCMASRQSMLSGQYPSANGCVCNGIEMSEDTPTIQSILHRYGYRTANIGKLHFKNQTYRDQREPHPAYGFDHLVLADEPGCYDDAYIKWVEHHDPTQVENCRVSTPPGWPGRQIVKQPRNTHEPYLFEGPEHLTHSAFVADEMIEFLQSRPPGQSFFAIAGFYAPHPPLNPPARFVEMYDPARLPLPLMKVGESHLDLSGPDWQKIKAYYYALISHMDDQVGRILDALDSAGQREDTLVIFTADHGEHLGDHGRVQKGPPGYDSCTHVPLIVSWPGRFKGGQRSTALVEAVDLAPTILDCCGVQAPPFFQGRSLRPLLEQSQYTPKESVFIEYREPLGISWKTLRTETHKLCVSNQGAELLFDLQTDPGELNDVCQEAGYQDILTQLRRAMLERWFSVEKQYPRRTGPY